MTAAPDPAQFRAQFPVLKRIGYLNAGTEGPVPQSAADALGERIEVELIGGRSGQNYMDGVKELATELRAAYASVLGCAPDELALTGSTTDGVNTVLAALDLRPGEEVLTSDEEHPGLLAPLALARRRRGITIRVVPFTELAGAVSASTRLVACSHVSWVGGLVVDHVGLAATGVPLLLDGAQGIGAVPADVAELGCDFYAASGQKWLCGPESSGCLFVRPERFEEMEIAWPGYGSLADPHDALGAPPAEGAARFDHGFPPGIRSVWALASLAVLEAAGWSWVHGRAAELAATLAGALQARGMIVSPRGRSTLVSWKASDPEAEVARLAAAGLVVRSIPASGLVRASVGAWSSEAELDKLVTLAGS
jgi:L-cysteine/cystine lyase